MTNEVLTPAEVAKALSVSLATVYKLIAEGKIKAVRIGPKLLRIDKQQLNNFLRGQE
jgi:excisionase family DNA binding protein